MKSKKQTAEPSPVIENFEIRDEGGVLRQKYTMHDRKLHGPFLLYDEHARLLQESSFMHGRLEGEQRIYVQGRLCSINQFRDGRLNGLTQTFGNIGALASSTEYLNGLAHGESVAYDASGSVVRRAQYNKGRLHGDVVTYHPDGRIQSLSPYHHDLIHGEVVKYAPDGTEIERVRYFEGKPLDPVLSSSVTKELETIRTI
jgi:uncharacterized protein